MSGGRENDLRNESNLHRKTVSKDVRARWRSAVCFWLVPLCSEYARRCKRAPLCPTLFHPTDCCPPGSCVCGIPSKQSGVGCHFLLQGIFLTRGLNPHILCLPQWQPESSSASPGKLLSSVQLCHRQACSHGPCLSL